MNPNKSAGQKARQARLTSAEKTALVKKSWATRRAKALAAGKTVFEFERGTKPKVKKRSEDARPEGSKALVPIADRPLSVRVVVIDAQGIELASAPGIEGGTRLARTFAGAGAVAVVGVDVAGDTRVLARVANGTTCHSELACLQAAKRWRERAAPQTPCSTGPPGPCTGAPAKRVISMPVGQGDYSEAG